MLTLYTLLLFVFQVKYLLKRFLEGKSIIGANISEDMRTFELDNLEYVDVERLYKEYENHPLPFRTLTQGFISDLKKPKPGQFTPLLSHSIMEDRLYSRQQELKQKYGVMVNGKRIILVLRFPTRSTPTPSEIPLLPQQCE